MNLILLVLAIIFFAISALLGFDVFGGEHLLGWLALGLVCFAASFLAPVMVVPWRRSE